MKMFFVLLTMLFTMTANALPVTRLFRDVRLPSQKVLEYQVVTTPVVASLTRLKTGQATSTTVTTTVTSFTLQPDVPRNITIDPGGTTNDVPDGTAVVTGTNIWGHTISENFTLVANSGTAIVGSKAFKTVTSVLFPIQDGGGATYDIGVGSKLGLNHCAKNAGALAFSIFDGAYETTRGTMAADATHVESNTFTPNGTMNGSKDVEVVYIQNYGCFP